MFHRYFLIFFLLLSRNSFHCVVFIHLIPRIFRICSLSWNISRQESRFSPSVTVTQIYGVTASSYFHFLPYLCTVTTLPSFLDHLFLPLKLQTASLQENAGTELLPKGEARAIAHLPRMLCTILPVCISAH